MNSPTPSLAEQINLISYLDAALKAKFFIALIGLICGALAYSYNYAKPEIYESYVKINVVNMDDPGGISPDNRRASEVMTLVEHGFVLGSTRNNHLAITLVKLQSRQFSLDFMAKHNVYAEIFPDHWDKQNERWIADFEPDIGVAFTQFNQSIRLIEHNPETDVISLRFRWHKAELTRDWANAYVNDFNKFMRDKALADVAKKRAFLENELRESRVVDMQKSIYRLIEAQMAVSMLANAKEEFILEVIDPAILPLDTHSASNQSLFFAGSIGGAIFTIFLIFSKILLTSIKQALAQHNTFVQPTVSAQLLGDKP
jgi:uncharacterized protein involved in exopolysaccharide biosynthesis